MRVFRGFHHPGIARECALTIGNFDGVHRGHQAMLALLTNEAHHRGLPSCVLTFEPHPRDFFALRAGKPDLAPARIANLRDKLGELERCGIDQVVVLRFDEALASLPPQAFIEQVLVRGLGARYVLVGDDFRFGARRAGDYAMLDAAGAAAGFDVARMMSYEVHGLRVSSSAVREALAVGDMERVASLLGRPFSISGHVQHGRKLGRELGFRTLNLRFRHAKPAASSPCTRTTKMPCAAACCWKRIAWIGPPGSAKTAAMAAWCGWSCCTSCTTNGATSRWTPCAPASPRTRRMPAPGWQTIPPERAVQKRRAMPPRSSQCTGCSVSGLRAAGPSRRPPDTPQNATHCGSMSMRQLVDSPMSRRPAPGVYTA
jgi:riboflavin kinase / FMN adenylyltransferase